MIASDSAIGNTLVLSSSTMASLARKGVSLDFGRF